MAEDRSAVSVDLGPPPIYHFKGNMEYAAPGTSAWVKAAQVEIERLRDRGVCSGCGGDVAESGACIAECGEGEMIPASELPLALRQMREQRDEWRQEAMSL